MSHDIEIVIEENKCDCCNRSDITQVADYGVSYNHCWIWYKKFDTEKGFKAIYSMTIDEAIPKMEKMKADMVEMIGEVPTHTMNNDGSVAWGYDNVETIDGKMVADDGWATTNFNAYRCIDEMITISKRIAVENPKAMWRGD